VPATIIKAKRPVFILIIVIVGFCLVCKYS
jgi:hypothetical protein